MAERKFAGITLGGIIVLVGFALGDLVREAARLRIVEAHDGEILVSGEPVRLAAEARQGHGARVRRPSPRARKNFATSQSGYHWPIR